MQFAKLTLSIACIRSGITCETALRAIRDYVSITCSSSPLIAARLKTAGVDRDVRGEAGASDHAPVWITLKKRHVA